MQQQWQQTLGQHIDRVIIAVVGANQRFAAVTIVLSLALASAAAMYTANHAAIDTDTEDMLSAELAWRKAYSEFKQAFPQFIDTIVVVVDAPTPDLALEASQRLSEDLSSSAELFKTVMFLPDHPFFKRNQLLYLDTPALENLALTLNEAQALLGLLAASPNLNGLLGVIEQLAQHQDQTNSAGAERLLNAVNTAMEGWLNGDRTPLSWQRLFSEQPEELPTRYLMVVQPHLDYSEILPGAAAIAALRAASESIRADYQAPINIRLTGGAALGYDELSSVIRGAEQAGVLAFLMVALCLMLGLRSFSLVIATLVALIVGLIFTATFAVAAVGSLNMISVAFAVLYVGLGVDFAIHICLRYRELCAITDQREAVLRATRHIGGSIALCALTTALAFFAFIPTAYRGVAELGLISGVGMFIGLLVSLTLLPAILTVLPAPKSPPRPVADNATGPHSTNSGTRRLILALSTVAVLIAIALLPRTEFDLDPINLNDQQAESVRTFNELARDDSHSLYALNLLADSAEEARQIAGELAALDEVSSAISIHSLIPRDQSDKLAIIDELNFTLGVSLDAVNAAPTQPSDVSARLESIRQLSTPADNNASALTPPLERFNQLGAAITQQLAAADKTAAQTTAALEDHLMHHFPEQLERLREALGAQAVEPNNLPAALKQLWVSADGRYRVEVRPADTLSTNAAMERFVDVARSVGGTTMTGAPVINVEASRAVLVAFTQAFATALVLISVLLWCIFGRIGEVLIALAPLLIAALVTTAIAVILQLPFNFANVIALPLLMGIGIDSAIHMMHRYKSPGRRDRSLLRTSTARAVLFSALTTTASFGNLAGSPHAGTASMGVMLSIGLGVTLLCTLIVLPALLHQFVTPRQIPAAQKSSAGNNS